MPTIFPLSASVGQEFQGYMYDGTIWNLIGNEYNPTTFSSTPPANPKPGDLWVDANSNVDILNEENLAYASDLNNYLTIESASSTYATKTELENIDLSPYLTISSASTNYATKVYVDTAIDNIPEVDLTSYATKTYADNSASVAAAAVIDAAPATLDTLNELAAALGDDANFATSVTNSLANKLNASSASITYLTIANAQSTYLQAGEAPYIYAPLLNPTFSGSSTFTDVIINGKLSVSEMVENVVSASVSNQTVELNYNASNIFYINSPGSSFGTYLVNAPTDEGKTFTISIIVNQAAVGYRPNEFFINGSSQTIRWVGGSAPTPTSSSGKIDIFSFTIIRISGSWIVLGTHSTNF